ncbi:unnamed protein product [Calicophoron daubneyi]|uniref:E3 ubiquitin-protein ligase TM129 n=1 Tax=Calicophoron daubneyi TaxID=300641 RepID=A0AAV2TLC5_CALDB
MLVSSPKTLIAFVEFTPLELLYTLLFSLLVFCFVFPPLEFVSAGVTLENTFGRFLGSENMFFFEYHIRRTAMLRVVYSFFILAYYSVMRSLSDNVVSNSPNMHPPFSFWDLVLWLGIALATFICSHTYFIWYAGGTWSGHPTMKSLRKIAESSSDGGQGNSPSRRCQAYISLINAECRRPDKFVAGQGGLSGNWPGKRFVVTDSWILSSHFIKFEVIKQSSDQMAAVVISSISVLDPESLTEGGLPAGDSLGIQTMVTLRFVDINSGTCLLSCGLPAANLDSLRAKLQCPIIRAQGVELEPTIVQRFIQAFSSVVSESEPITPPPDLDIDQCIGCMSKQADVVLCRRCDPETHSAMEGALGDVNTEPPCGSCQCRPMWCLECMARWFAARQTESHRPPSIWLSGKVPCPTCRAVFCVRDVVHLRIPDS